MVQTSTLNFLKILSKNNNKVWFDAHRNQYIDAKDDFGKFVSQLITGTSKFDADIKDLQLKDCVFRINRDIRFSKNKTPYKTNLAASLDKGGKKSIYAGYYFHLEPGKSFVAGGIWMPMAPDLKKIRQEIDYCFDEFRGIVTNKNFKAAYGKLEATDDIKLTNLPRGYNKENPAAEFLKLKSLIVSKPIADDELTKSNLVKRTTRSFEMLMPLIKFINKALE